MTATASRRELLSVAAGLAATTAVGSQVSAQESRKAFTPAPIPDLAPQWKKLNLAEILKRPAAFLLDQSEQFPLPSMGYPGIRAPVGAGNPSGDDKGLPRPPVATATSSSFSWIGYSVFRENYRQSDLRTGESENMDRGS